MIAEVEGLGLSGVCEGFLGAEAAEVEGLSSRRKGSLELLASLIRRGTDPAETRISISYMKANKNIVPRVNVFSEILKST